MNFTREERLILYEHTLKTATPVATPPELLPVEMTESFESQPKELSGLELKKAMRDFKRRRQAYRTKVSTKNKTQTEVTREIILNMMALVGVEEPELDLSGTSNRLPAPLSTPDGENDSDTLDKRTGVMSSGHRTATDSQQMRDLNYAKHPEQRPKRSEQESHGRSRNSRESVKDQKYDNRCHDSNRFSIKDEKNHWRMNKKCDIRSEGQGTSDKHQSRYRDKASSHYREKRRKSNDDLEYRGYDHREMRRDKKDKYENEGRYHRQESFSSKSRRRERSESRKRKSNDRM